MDKKNTYAAKLRDPRWQKQRLEILERDEWQCQACEDSESTLHVHHKWYERGKDPWEYPLDALVTLCERCHERETEELREEAPQLARAAARAGFMAVDLRILAEGFKGMPMVHMSEVVASALARWLRDEHLMRVIVDMYFELIHEQRLEEERAQAPPEEPGEKPTS